MRRKQTLFWSSWGLMLIGTIGLYACTGSRETALHRSIIPPRTVQYYGQPEIIENPNESPHFIPMAVKDAPRHKVYGNNYWKKLNRHITDALPSYSADKYMKEETSHASNKVKQKKSSGDSTISPSN